MNLKALSALLAAALALSGCVRYQVRQSSASKKYPVSASSSLFDEQGQTLYGPPVPNDGVFSKIPDAQVREWNPSLSGRIQQLKIVKHVERTERVWHWLFFSFGSEKDYGPEIDRLVAEHAGEGMINFHYIRANDPGRWLSSWTFQIFPWYSYVGFAGDIVVRKK